LRIQWSSLNLHGTGSAAFRIRNDGFHGKEGALSPLESCDARNHNQEAKLNKNIDFDRYEAALFDLDGVLTATAKLHAICWKQMLDQYLKHKSLATGVAFQPFDIDQDYRLYVEGKLRYEGVRDFLQSRDIEIPYGTPEDPPDEETICGLGNRKNQLLHEMLAAGNVGVLQGSVTLVRYLLEKKIHTAVVSASKNCEAVLKAAGIADLFEVRVDGTVAETFGLPSKPEPATLLKAAELLGVEPSRTIVIEGAIVGVLAGRKGKFGLVVGVDRDGDVAALKKNGADLVVSDLAELLPKQEIS
jgi:beta-phosphoglucomutase family hydrolase